MNTDIQITKSYPPVVEECRRKIAAIMDDIQNEAMAQVQAIHPLLPERERIQELQRIERRLQPALWPFVEELSLLENHATVTISMAA